MGHNASNKAPGKAHRGHIADSARCINKKQARKERLGTRMAARRTLCPTCSGQFNRCEWKRHSQRCNPKRGSMIRFTHGIETDEHGKQHDMTRAELDALAETCSTGKVCIPKKAVIHEDRRLSSLS